MVEAWAAAGQENKPRGKYLPARPHLVTIRRGKDSMGRTSIQRGKKSTRPYVCNLSQDQRDEYPQKLFEDNKGEASVKCVLDSDNQGSGSLIGYQVNVNGAYGFLEDGSVVEMVVKP